MADQYSVEEIRAKLEEMVKSTNKGAEVKNSNGVVIYRMLRSGELYHITPQGMRRVH